MLLRIDIRTKHMHLMLLCNAVTYVRTSSFLRLDHGKYNICDQEYLYAEVLIFHTSPL